MLLCLAVLQELSCSSAQTQLPSLLKPFRGFIQLCHVGLRSSLDPQPSELRERRGCPANPGPASSHHERGHGKEPWQRAQSARLAAPGTSHRGLEHFTTRACAAAAPFCAVSGSTINCCPTGSATNGN